jgi:hypothetical protein
VLHYRLLGSSWWCTCRDSSSIWLSIQLGVHHQLFRCQTLCSACHSAASLQYAPLFLSVSLQEVLQHSVASLQSISAAISTLVAAAAGNRASHTATSAGVSSRGVFSPLVACLLAGETFEGLVHVQGVRRFVHLSRHTDVTG